MEQLYLQRGKEAAIREGFPWVYRGDMTESSALLTAEPGSLVEIRTHKGEWVALGYYNPHSQIAARVLSMKSEVIDTAFFMARIKRALEKREALLGAPYYRLIHSESDGLPGLLVDRFGDILVCQVGAAGMEKLQAFWVQALEELVKPQSILLRNDVEVRAHEGLPLEVKLLKGTLPGQVEILENGCRYFAELKEGQKTGWFFDQRDNHLFAANRARGKTVLDVYSHSGGFGILAAMKGATQVVMVDSSRLALDLARKAAEVNGVIRRCEFIEGQAFEVMEKLNASFDMVLADPPAFIKSKQHLAAGLKGYEKVAKFAAARVAPGGMLMVASCSHHALPVLLRKSVTAGVKKAGRTAKILRESGAAADHPVHPKLPQSAYLKAIWMELD